MNITTAQVKEIRQELAKLKPVKVTLDGTRRLTVKEAIFALAPTLERMKKRGFDTQEIADKLHEKGIEVKPPTLAKYLNEFRRGKGGKRDTAPAPMITQDSTRNITLLGTSQARPEREPLALTDKKNPVEQKSSATEETPVNEL